jgi:phage shock protein PspC (stress-responsive transcriptional regulator)
MDDMNETTFGPSTPPGAPQGPSAPPPHQDLERLRRSVTDRYVAGVAGGLGRHFGIDPTIIRVLLAVLTLFGGAGVLIYAVAWLFVPEDGRDRAPIHVGGEPRKILLLAAVGIAGLLAVGDAFSGFNAGWPIASIAVIIGVVLIARDRKDGKTRPAPAAPAQPWAAAEQPPIATSYTAPVPPDFSAGPTPPAPPAWQPPVGKPPLVPPHPKRTGILWFWPTLALIAIGLGVVGIIDTGSHHVDAGVYPAVAVAITGVMLLVGSFFGRPGGLILIGIVSTMALSVATVLGTFHVDGRNLEANPKTAAEVQPSYDTHMGRIVLDLTDVTDPASLAGREIDLSLNAGEITVIVPKSLNVDIDAELGFAGGIKIPGYDGGGIQDSAERHLTGTPATNSESLDLDIDVRVGQINVEQR